MAIGDKKPVVMQSDRAVPSGIATLGTDGKLLDAQIPGLDKLGAAPAVESAEHPGCYYRMVNGVVEWVNPPMALNEEYRTTERYNGKPVYVKVRESGSLAIGSSSSPSNSHIEGFSGQTLDVVRNEIYIVSINNPGMQYKNTLIDDSGNILCSTRVYIPAQTNPNDAWAFCTFRCFADMSAYKGRAYLWYTKNTD